MKEPTKAYGYIMLKVGDVTQKGDEYWSNTREKWLESICPGKEIIKGSEQYRRKINAGLDHRFLKDNEIIEKVETKVNRDPGEGYRLLMPGETIDKNDEVLSRENSSFEAWETTGSPNRVIESNGRYTNLLYRRKIEPKISIEKQLADMGEAFAKLDETHSKTVTELTNLRIKIQDLSNENKKLQNHVNIRNEHIKDLEFAIRKMRKAGE